MGAATLSLVLPTLDRLRAPVDRHRYLADPVAWCEERLGSHLWSKQREIMESVRDHHLTAVPTAFNIGKSWVAARVVAWWIDTHPPGTARVLTSAPTAGLVKAVLWHEIGRAHSAGDLPGRLNQTEWWLEIEHRYEDGRYGTREEMVAFGRKPAEQNVEAIHGVHERYVLVVTDESPGMPTTLWDAFEGAVSGADCRWLAIGNPNAAQSSFRKACSPGSGWNVIQVSAYDSPNLSGEPVPEEITHRLVSRRWVEQREKRWGRTNPRFVSKVLGEFPEDDEDGLIPASWVARAEAADLSHLVTEDSPNELGVDVGGGKNKNTICWRRGPVARIIHRDQNPDTMKTLCAVLRCLRQTEATVAKVDEVGIGKGVVDRAREIARDPTKSPQEREIARRVFGVNVGQPARDTENYVNLRAEGYWALRERAQDGELDIGVADDLHDDEAADDLAAQLVGIQWEETSRGKVQVESKKDMRKRGVESPDDADAVMLAFVQPSKGWKQGGAWGSRSRRRDRGGGRGEGREGMGPDARRARRMGRR